MKRSLKFFNSSKLNDYLMILWFLLVMGMMYFGLKSDKQKRGCAPTTLEHVVR